MSELRQIPSVDQIIRAKPMLDCISAYGRPLTLQAIRIVLDETRKGYSAGDSIPAEEKILETGIEK
jgi:hypothetical protein